MVSEEMNAMGDENYIVCLDRLRMKGKEEEIHT